MENIDPREPTVEQTENIVGFLECLACMQADRYPRCTSDEQRQKLEELYQRLRASVIEPLFRGRKHEHS